MNTKQKKLLAVMLALTVFAVIGMLATLHFAAERDANAFLIPTFDANAETGTPVPAAETGYAELDAERYTVSLCGAPTVSADGQSVDLYFTNPADNDVWLKVRIYNSAGDMLGETGLLKAGEYVKTVILSAPLSQETTVALKIMAYEPDTYYSAGSVVLNTTLRPTK